MILVKGLPFLLVFLSACQFGFSYEKTGENSPASDAPLTPQDTDKIIFSDTLQNLTDGTTQAGRWVDGVWRGISKIESQLSSEALGEFQMGQNHFVLGFREVNLNDVTKRTYGIWKNNDWSEIKLPAKSGLIEINPGFGVGEAGQTVVSGRIRASKTDGTHEIVLGNWVNGEWKNLPSVENVKSLRSLGPVAFSADSEWILGSFINNEDLNSIGFWSGQRWSWTATLDRWEFLETPSLLSSQGMPLILGIRKKGYKGQMILVQGPSQVTPIDSPEGWSFLGPTFIKRNPTTSQIMIAANFEKEGRIRAAFKELGGNWMFLNDDSPEQQTQISNIKFYKDQFHFFGIRETQDSKIEVGAWAGTSFKVYSLPEKMESLSAF